MRIRFAVEDGNGNQRQKSPPMAPLRQLQQVVGADQPDQAALAVPLQPAQRVDRVAGAEALLEIAADDARIAARASACAEAKRSAKLAMPATGFNGFCGETSHQTRSSREAPERLAADREMALVRRVERAAEQPDPQPAAAVAPRPRPAAAG